jgi:lipopolysaccharide/colanic/teichoic acid biosynthesis glycosyltransferase
VLRISLLRVHVDHESDEPGAAPASDQANRSGRNPSKIALAAKRALDISLSAALGIVTLPVMILIAVAIRIDSPGPVLFRAARVGHRGKHFPMFKFRTMVADAQERFNDIAHLNVASGMVKIPNDPRVTRIGKWLRRFSLDELPQFYNVLVGHMSIVGPRPHDVHELHPDGLELDPRLSVRPGLTGLWQVNARSDPHLASRIHHDLQYVSQWSLLLDASILAKTLPVVIFGKGGRVDGILAGPSNGDHSELQLSFPNEAHIGKTGRDLSGAAPQSATQPVLLSPPSPPT